jgi:hypothetical protein
LRRPRAPISTGASWHVPGWLHALVPIAVLGLWALAIDGVRPDEMSDIGLVSVLPPSAILLLFVLTASFVLSLTGPLRAPVTIGHIVVLIVMLYGVTAFVEPVPRFETVWKHVGIMDYIARHDSVDPSIDAYFSWPGFFIVGALITKAAGFGSPLAIAAWGPLAFNLLLLPPLLVLFRAATDDRRLVWLGLWLFYSMNWVGQDYIAPQAVGFLLWVSMAAILLTWFVPRSTRAASRAPPRGLISRFNVRRIGFRTGPEVADAAVTPPAQRAGLLLVVVGIFAAIVTGHQLTPFAVLLSVAGLVLFAGLPTRGLPWVMALMVAAWIGYMTTTYLAGHIETLAKPIGSLGSNLDQNVTNRLGGSHEHEVIARMRLYTTASIWLLALAGLALRRLAGRSDTALVVMGGAPFVLLVLQPYGGEMLLRVFLFTLPSVAFFAASLVFSSPLTSARRWTFAGVTVLGCCLLLSVFQFTRYGNERMDAFTKGDVAAVHALYRLAPRGATLYAGSYNLPWRYRNYADYDYRVIADGTAWQKNANDSSAVIRELQRTSGRTGAYIIVTRSTRITEDLLSSSPGALENLVTRLRSSPAARGLYHAPDGDIFYLRAPA